MNNAQTTRWHYFCNYCNQWIHGEGYCYGHGCNGTWKACPKELEILNKRYEEELKG